MKRKIIFFHAFLAGICIYGAFNCNDPTKDKSPSENKIAVIFDTDANNEVDDQHALAYLLLSGHTFQVEAITVNATSDGGDIEQHFAEAERVLKLCDAPEDLPLLKGANGSFEEIQPQLGNEDFDGAEAVHFIIESAKAHVEDTLTLIAVGKLTNVALAVAKDPSIIPHIRLVWLGSNYPEPGEYNLENDIPSMNYLLKSGIEFDMVVVRYGKPSGTDAIRVVKGGINREMPGLGPHIEEPVTGRHGGSFSNFGDYSIDLFAHTEYYGRPPSRALFDMTAVAIVKNPDWAEKTLIPGPTMVDNQWVEQVDNPRQISLWENFDKDEILANFYTSLKYYQVIE